MTLWCDCCGDQVKVVYPCKFVFYDGTSIDFNVCIDCMERGKLVIDLPRKKRISEIVMRIRDLKKTE